MSADEIARIRELGRLWMRSSLAEQPATEEQKRRIRILLRAEAKAS